METGELLFEANQWEEATAAFNNSMYFFPNRTRTLLGLARSYDRLHDTPKATEYYQRLLYQLRKSDLGLDIYQEAYNYIHPSTKLTSLTSRNVVIL